jgi:hypothetical protein
MMAFALIMVACSFAVVVDGSVVAGCVVLVNTFPYSSTR